MKKNLPVVVSMALSFLIFSASANAQSKVIEADFKAAPPDGWITINNSNPVGIPSGWFHGLNRPFFSASDDKSYIGCNYNSVDSLGNISAWLITPTLILKNGGQVTFLTRTVNHSLYPDRLEVRLNSTDTTTNVGTSDTSVGSFSNLLISINPDLVVGGYPDSSWASYTIILSGITAKDTGRIAFRYYVTDGGYNGMNSNYIGIDSFRYSAGSLPVTFTGFDGSIHNGMGLLTWSTATEVNNKGFNIERSADGISFSPIGFVAGKGTTSFASNYTFSDPKLVSGNNYYRLKQIDLDGNYNYSSTIKLSYSKFDFSILGNGLPNSWMQLQLDKAATVSIQIISLDGKVMQTIDKGNLQTGTYSVPLDLSKAAAGMYIVKLLVNGQVYSKNIFKN